MSKRESIERVFGRAMVRDWIVSLDWLEIRWREPLTPEDICDIEELFALVLRGMRRRVPTSLEPAEGENVTALDTTAASEASDNQ